MNFLNLPFQLTGDKTIKALDRLRPLAGEDNTVSLRDLDFIDPFGLLMLLSYVRYLSMVLDRVWLYLPRKENVMQYLVRSGFLKEVSQYASLIPAQPQLNLRQTQDEMWLIPITTLRAEDDVPEIVTSFLQNMKRIFLPLGGDLNPDQIFFCTLLSELCQNIPQHSRDHGYVAVQSYRTKNGKEIHIALADLGVGLRGSLSQGHAIVDWPEESVVRYALQQGISASKEVGRGQGLAQVIKSLQRFQGAFYLRSGNGLFSQILEREEFLPCSFFPGVQVSLILKMRD